MRGNAGGEIWSTNYFNRTVNSLERFITCCQLCAGYNVRMIAVLHNVRSVYNVGSIFRTADGVQVEKIYLCGITPAPYDKFGRARLDFAKVSLGAEKHVNWEYYASTARLIRELKAKGFVIFAVEQSRNSVLYKSIRLSKKDLKKTAIIFGNEVKGIPPSLLKMADRVLEIPMRGAIIKRHNHSKRTGKGKESLNVSVAFGIITYHFYK